MDRRKWVVLVFIIIFLFGAEYYLFSDKDFYRDHEEHTERKNQHAQHTEDKVRHTAGASGHDSIH